MAYGIKYKLDFCNVDGMPLRYEVLKRNYTGEQLPVTGTGSPIIINKAGKNIDSALIPTEAVIQIREGDGFNADDVYTSDEKEYLVKYYENNILDWSGYLLPDFLNREIGGFPVIELSAVDHLGMLKDIPYQNSNGKPFDVKQSLLTVLINCIKATDIELNIKVVVDIICSEWDPIDPVEPSRNLSFFRDTYIEAARFSDDNGNVASVHDVLETTLNLCNARICIEKGSFWITNRREIELGIGTVYTFNLTGTQIGPGVALNPNITNIELIDVGGMQEVAPANSASQIYSEHGPSFPAPKNNSFQGYNAGTYPNWTNYNGYQIENTNVDVFRFNSDGTINSQGVTEVARPWIKSKLDFRLIDGAINLSALPYMEGDAIDISSSASKGISLSMGIKGHYEDPVAVALILKSFDSNNQLRHTYLLRDNGDWIEHKNEEYTKNYIGFSLPKPEGRTSTTPFSVDMSFSIASNGMPATDRTEFRFELSTRIYGHLRGGDGKYMMTIQSLSIEIQNENEPKGILYSAINSGKFTKKVDPLLTLFSDKVTDGKGSPFSAVVRTITSNLFTRSGELTENWTGLGSTGSGYLLSVVVNQLASSDNISKKALSISFDGVRLSFSDRYSISCLEGLFMIRSYSYNPLYKSATVELISCSLVNRNDFLTITSPRDNDKGTNIQGVGSIPSGGGGGSASQGLQSVTDIDPNSTHIISVGGTRNKNIVTIPTRKPLPEEIIEGEAYIFFNEVGSGGGDTPVGVQYFRDLLDVNKPLDTGWLKYDKLTGMVVSDPNGGGASEAWVNNNFLTKGYLQYGRLVGDDPNNVNDGVNIAYVANNIPTESFDGALLSFQYDQDYYASQLFLDWRKSEMSIRSQTDTVWGSWFTIWSSNNHRSDLQNDARYPLVSSLGSFAYRNSIDGNEVLTYIDYQLADIGISKYMRWSMHGSGHIIFDASSGLSPRGTDIDRSNSLAPWDASSNYTPTLMGWNGMNTYGVRVDSARISDHATRWGGQLADFGVEVLVPTSIGAFGVGGELMGYALPTSINLLLGMPSGGDTLQSVAQRGNESTVRIGSSAGFLSGVGENGGLSNRTYSAGYNNIWRFHTDPLYGIAYYQGLPPGDRIGFHFGDKMSPKFSFWLSGNLDATSFKSAYSGNQTNYINLNTQFDGGISSIGDSDYGLHIQTSIGSGNTIFQSKHNDSRRIAYHLLFQNRGGAFVIGADALSGNYKFQVGRSQNVPMEGSVSATLNSSTISGSQTRFLTDFKRGQQIYIKGELFYVSSIISNASMVVSRNATTLVPTVWPYATEANMNYGGQALTALSVATNGDVVAQDLAIKGSVALPIGKPKFPKVGEFYLYIPEQP